MSWIFRSDKPEPGERVVVRRVLHSQEGTTHSDIIGHVICLDPLIIRPQKVGGYPSELKEITLPAEEVGIVKRLSPRTVRNSEIRAVEVATAAAFPGKEHTWTSDGQWLMRAGDGVTERSNSAAPLGPSAGFTPVPLKEINDFYARHNLPVQLLLPERIARAAERILDGSWQLGPEIIVMTRDLTHLPDCGDDWEFHVDEQPDEAWLNLYHFRGQALPPQALEYLRKRINGTMGFGRLTAHGKTVAITRGTLTESGEGTCWLGYSAVEVAPDWRRRGLGTQLGAHMLHWGAHGGATRAYLQVLSSNTIGIHLYEKLGFLEHHRHRYARRVSSNPCA